MAPAALHPCFDRYDRRCIEKLGLDGLDLVDEEVSHAEGRNRLGFPILHYDRLAGYERLRGELFACACGTSDLATEHRLALRVQHGLLEACGKMHAFHSVTAWLDEERLVIASLPDNPSSGGCISCNPEAPRTFTLGSLCTIRRRLFILGAPAPAAVHIATLLRLSL